MKKNILVFPCGSEIGLELNRSLKYSIHFHLIGGSSVDDHGKFVYEDYINKIPFISSSTFINSIAEIVKKRKIDAIYPTMDEVIVILKKNEDKIGCKIISSCLETVTTCLSKTKSYEKLKEYINVPKIFTEFEDIIYPIFSKPDIGYGSRGAKLIQNKNSLLDQIAIYPNSIFCQYLSGEEYTVDCFTNKNGVLQFFLPRKRRRIINGISVNTTPTLILDEYKNIVEKINQVLSFRGGWFVQLKRDSNGDLYLLEIAARIAGSSSLSRNIGVNIPMLTLFDLFDYNVDIIQNNYEIELDRALNNIYIINVDYNEVFIDFDDCLLLNKKNINTEIIKFIFQCINRKIKLTLITKHKGNLIKSLENFRLLGIFDRIIQIDNLKRKFEYIDNKKSIFIDDSYSERKDVALNIGIPVFSPDMIESLIY